MHDMSVGKAAEARKRVVGVGPFGGPGAISMSEIC